MTALFAEPSDTPFWASGAVVGAVVAALGYVAKQAADLLLALWRERKSQRARLIELRSLLRASRATFLNQRKLAKRLSESLREARPDLRAEDGYEKVFSDLYPEFTPEEKELHAVIRGMTEHSIRPLNSAMTDWLRADTTFKAARGKGPWVELADKLRALEAHLVMWLAKYQAWIPGQQRHALVYLEDEQAHGVGFPDGIDELVERLV